MAKSSLWRVSKASRIPFKWPWKGLGRGTEGLLTEVQFLLRFDTEDNKRLRSCHCSDKRADKPPPIWPKYRLLVSDQSSLSRILVWCSNIYAFFSAPIQTEEIRSAITLFASSQGKSGRSSSIFTAPFVNCSIFAQWREGIGRSFLIQFEIFEAGTPK